MKILLYNPDNGVTRNFMPHLWMFLLKSLTPPGHEVLLIDGNAQPMDELQIAQYVRDEIIRLVGIGAMTRMIAKALQPIQVRKSKIDNEGIVNALQGHRFAGLCCTGRIHLISSLH